MNENKNDVEQSIEELRRDIETLDIMKHAKELLDTDGSTAGRIAGFLYGADDPVGALQAIRRIWLGKEKKLKTEMLSGANTSVVPVVARSIAVLTVTPEQFKQMGYGERLKLHRENPDEYEKLVGRG